jgi:hypothetical protein
MAAYLRCRLTINAAFEERLKVLVPVQNSIYTEVSKEAQRLWETMLPFARCTADPGRVIASLYEFATVFPKPDYAGAVTFDIHLSGHHGLPIHSYKPGISAADLQALEEALAEATKTNPVYIDVLDDFTISVSFGPVEIKLNNNCIEAEYVAGAAVRTQFNWKSKEMEVGVGAGYKAKVGVAGGMGAGVEAKGYVNLVLDLRNNEITDVYISGEAKGSLGGYGSGGQARASLMGKGLELSTAAKHSIGIVGVEHTTEILKWE